MILGTAPEEARPAAIPGTTKSRYLHVFTLDLYGRDLVYGRMLYCVCDKYCDV
jgi:hypothetical protein